MRILLCDIETSPNTAYVWSLWKQNVSLDQLVETSKVLCWSAKWYQENVTYFDSINRSPTSTVLGTIHNMLDKADVVVHYNGQNFDIPTLNREFLTAGMKPPAPYKQVDLLQVARKQFRFASNKLAHVAKELGFGGKSNQTNFTLWVRCMNGDPVAWKEMEAYNRNDVAVLEQVYNRFLPWITSHPNHGLYSGGLDVCGNCGSSHLQRRGYAFTNALKYQRWQCQDCGNWQRSKKPEDVTKKAKYGNII
jgi:hypothetical protein